MATYTMLEINIMNNLKKNTMMMKSLPMGLYVNNLTTK